ncbi:MAG: transcriptional regulator TrmB [Candidatus Peregrinibacteria bacterium GW2011_GWF2_33_10]|nr:MAG: transcriptional regulator TrmB [Candidatus Peregrinibacteria bacterium GW2011_GWF2_33_10]OGJ44775.1 MAG: hypothetical protein A2263_06065 [Candidatus Peregrinibacteria bacterium RIFOXYA2_FULL_33_21]OGJ46932.1 MAG: hypothetical protein A2272_00105 [Candidatus Peregrinibacteria bacterium RIFOXYA12_FULL_33_12]OGJ50461.1 MAG: hypothetical protein A2307_02690 [Candidatus Peregrinibacteria bacterium RIFOXYB2_FULL_33_20]
MIYDDLISLGLTKEEIKVYLATLELGGGFVSVIASKAKVHRVTCYNTLSNLIKKGLLSFTKHKNIRFYSPEPPQVLLNDFEDKHEIAKKVLPELISLQNKSAFKPKIRYYEEKKNMKLIFEDMNEAKTEILGYTNLTALTELFGDELKRFADNLINKKIKARFLTPFDDENIKIIKNLFKNAIDNNVAEILCVDKNQFDFKSGVFFYDNKTAIISYDKNELLGVIIESSVNTETQKAIFNLAWLGATSFVAK